jgi:hypothetical protein
MIQGRENMTFEEAIRELDLRHPVTHERLDADELISFFKEDIILTARRPGCWEASNMAQVLLCHGFLECNYR